MTDDKAEEMIGMVDMLPDAYEKNSVFRRRCDNDNQSDDLPIRLATGKGEKRRKERCLSEIIAKVTLWTRMWSGIVEEDAAADCQQKVRVYSRSEAAVKLDMSRKTLEDYLL